MRKNLLLYVSVPLFVSSCSYYQYGTIQSSEVQRNDQREFVAENDTLRVVYNFNGLNAPINLTIYNKLDVPVTVDWQRSALIMGDVAFSYVPDKVPIEGSFDGTSSGITTGTGYTSTSGTIHGSARVPEEIAFIPPQTRISKSPIHVTSHFLQNVADTAYHRVKYYSHEGVSMYVKKAAFTEASSPLRFKSYLTVKVGDGSLPVVYQHAFYVSEVMNTGHGPNVMWADGSPANQYYVQKSTGVAGAVLGAALISAVVIGVASQANKTNPQGN